MNSCQSCLHYRECMERRGQCREYKDLKGVIEDIEMLNQKAKLTARSEADTARARKERDWNRASFGSAARETDCNRRGP